MGSKGEIIFINFSVIEKRKNKNSEHKSDIEKYLKGTALFLDDK